MKNKVFAFMDEEADWIIIVGTADRVKAENALREVETEWYGKDHKEEPTPIDEFSAVTLYHGERNGSEGYYWGADPASNPKKYFDGGKYDVEPGFVAPVN